MATSSGGSGPCLTSPRGASVWRTSVKKVFIERTLLRRGSYKDDENMMRHGDSVAHGINSSRLLVFIAPSFLRPRGPTAPAWPPLRTYFGKTPAAPSQARKRSARHHSVERIPPVPDCKTPQQGESRRSPVQAAPDRYRSRKPVSG